MDPKQYRRSAYGYRNGFNVENLSNLPVFDQPSGVQTRFKFDTPRSFDFPLQPDPSNFGLQFTLNPLGKSFFSSVSSTPDGRPLNPSSGWTPEQGASASLEDCHSPDPVLKYISKVLLEENMENKPHMFYDPLALKATEKSLYDVLGEQCLSSRRPLQSYIESPNSDLLRNRNDCSCNFSTSNGTSIATSSSNDPQLASDFGASKPSLSHTFVSDDLHSDFNLQPNSQFKVNPSIGLADISNGIKVSHVSEIPQHVFSDSKYVLQFKRALEEASQFLLSGDQLVFNLESSTFSKAQNSEPSTLEGKKFNEKDFFPNGSRGRKNHGREDLDVEESRSTKQSAVSVEENELSELFDKVLLMSGMSCNTSDACEEKNTACKTSLPVEQPNVANSRKARRRNKINKEEAVDLRNLLIFCSQAVSANDFRTVNELLSQIRHHSSPFGDGIQRIAHYFANGLEARLASSGIEMKNFFSALASKRINLADALKCYKVHLNACPFKKINVFFANKMIMKAAEKATTIHIVDFGILFGFQWPVLIQHLSARPGGPPKLRITGIELPHCGFRIADQLKETGHLLSKYCERFNVPFDYNPIVSQNWEDMQIEDLKIDRHEVLAVNCQCRFKNLLDETAQGNCPRDAVLKLIRKIKPDIFVHTITNGSYNAPFFVTRFREALFFFSAFFDMFDHTLPRDDPERLIFEREFYGREVLNVIAREGLERVDRPETYKQWQVRTTRAGFRQLPLDQDLMKLLRHMKSNYHKDFVIDEDSNWMLQGWKGRITCASCCWVPV